MDFGVLGYDLSFVDSLVLGGACVIILLGFWVCCVITFLLVCVGAVGFCVGLSVCLCALYL